MRYAPGKVPARPLPAAPPRPGVKPTVTGAPAVMPTPLPAPGTGGRPPILGMRPPGMGTTGGGLPAPGTGGRPKLPMMKKGGKVSSASSRADGCAIKGKTKGKMV